MTAELKHDPETEPTHDEGDGLAFVEEWKAEVQRRAEEHRSGRVKGIPLDEMMAEIDAEFGW